jgi:hypothetical protein
VAFRVGKASRSGELPTLYTFREDLIMRIDGFTEKAEALEAAGLSE